MSSAISESRPYGADLSSKVATLLGLGITNLARVGAYRLALKVPASRVRRLSAATPSGTYFETTSVPSVKAPPSSAWGEQSLLFGYARTPLHDEPPDWHKNPLTGRQVDRPQRPWWAIPDFDAATGDIKGVWELSRFDWAPVFAQRGRNGDVQAIARLNAWLQDWSEQNPPYLGPNWKCGQEASIRVMHLAMAQIVLGDAREAAPGLRQLLAAHLRRIAPTTSYATAQENNHGTSEAAALFIGGTWLGKEGRTWEKAGRSFLENRVERLIQDDGSFSQYSVNYHRLVLDTLALAEIWRRRLSSPPFSAAFYRRAAAATEWLRRLVNPRDGDAPNVGANDGAKLIALGDEDYRDHRSSVQLCAALFLGGRAFGPGPWDAAAAWLGVQLPTEQLSPPGSDPGDDGGFGVLRNPRALALLRYPRFRFRPSQSDLLHLDLWVDGENLLRDGGSYSYNADPATLAYFGGVESHNTVQFDRRDQMPRLGRFLFGAWPKAQILEPLSAAEGCLSVRVAYEDAKGCRHERAIELGDDRLRVEDRISGFESTAVLRWRLAPGDWSLVEGSICKDNIRLSVASQAPIERLELRRGYESRRYLERTELPVLEIEVREPATLTTELRWA